MPRDHKSSHSSRRKAAEREQRRQAKDAAYFRHAGGRVDESRRTSDPTVTKPGTPGYPCRKVGYHDQARSLTALAVLREKSQAERVPVRTYRCPRCGMWHLTSRERA